MLRSPSIDVVIRTCGYSSLLSTSINSLVNQNDIQLRIILVNSGRSDEGLSSLVDHSVVIPYVSSRFNYSEAINQAIPLLKREFTLIISSHTIIRNPLAVAYGIFLLDSNPLAAAVNFSGERDDYLSYHSVDIESFNGWNGTWNTATLYRTKLLQDRPFRPEILSAEDQEWSRWVIEQRGMVILHVIGCNTINANPRKDSIAKRLKCWEFISAYAYPSYLSFRFVASRFRLCVYMLSRFRIPEALFELLVAFVLIRVRLFGVYSPDSGY